MQPRVVPIRVAGIALTLAALWYAPWLYRSLNGDALWIALPFAAANLLVVIAILITVINNWQRAVPATRLVAAGHEPPVAVLIPTYGEPVEMVAATAASVLGQAWPEERLIVVVSDDGHRPAVAAMVAQLAGRHPRAQILYHEPPRQGAAERRGDAKSGNLNSALAFVAQRFPDVAYIETRDADDEVGHPLFLSATIGQLLADGRVAFVQTVKEARVSPGDPFGNNDPLFYRGSMLARHAANAVFPCGSGLVWRREALHDIGDFPTWNLVEDLHSGVEALRRGWRGVYLPLVGARAQHAPEDVPNAHKQRGTWALDTMRLLIWGNLRGLSLRQRLHFVELGLFYLLSFTTLVFLIVPVISFTFGIYPLTTTQWAYALHFWPFAVLVEVFLITLNPGQPYESLWRARQMWLGMAPVYMRATLIALVNGPRRKPVYRVTRKVTQSGWYWRETAFHWGFLGVLVAAALFSAWTNSLLTEFDLGSAFWASYFALLLIGYTQKGWLGFDWRGRFGFGRLARFRGQSPDGTDRGGSFAA